MPRVGAGLDLGWTIKTVNSLSVSILSPIGLDLTYTRKSCHFRSPKRSDNEAQDKNRTRV